MADEYSIVPVNSSKCTMNPLFSVLFLGLACVSTIFQILAFSTHGWVVMTEFLTDNYTDDVRSVEIYTGLWYTVKCENGACSSVTHHEAFKEDIANGHYFKEIQYSLRVWSQVLCTLALLASILAAVFCVPFLCKTSSFLRYHLVVVLTSTISFCLLSAVVFNWTAEVASTNKLKLNQNLTFYFPWSLLLAGFGACGNLILDIVHFVLLFRSLAPNSEAARRETFHPNSYVQLRQISHDTTIRNGSCGGHDSQCKNQVTEEKELCDDSVEGEGVEEGDRDSVEEGDRDSVEEGGKDLVEVGEVERDSGPLFT
uniref:Uncharacterized protein n=1 Tax=Magallana gigas TaxID=29159 RepID=K1R6G0_MAGGI|eukprot:XP_019922935.1 PREDICTED: uncharacterized protein LOC105328667 [Crassostrea gigas]